MIKKFFSVPSRSLFLVFLFALFLRLHNLDSLPYNMMEDEVLSGYVGRFILQNGEDLYGNKWPLLYFNKFGDYYIIGPMYLAGLSTYFFGINAFAVRFPAAFFGSLMVFAIYFFVNRLFNNNKISIISAFLLAITPWHIVLSRSIAEGIIGSTLFISGIVFFIKFIESKLLRNGLYGCLLLFLTYFIYHPFRIYAPLFLFFLTPLYYKEIKLMRLKYKFILILATIFFTLVTFFISTTSWGSGRLGQTSIFSPIARVEGEQLEQIYNLGSGRILEAKVFHNKVIAFLREFINQYLSYFSPNFLFTQGGAESRYDIPNQGLLYLTFLLLIIVSLVPVSKKIKINKKIFALFIYLIIISPVPAALTYYGSPNIHRSSFLAIFLVVPVALGIYKLYYLKFSKIFLGLISAILLFEILYFWHQYSTQSDIYTAIRRNDGQVKLIYFLEENYKNSKIFLPSEGTMSLYVSFVTQNFDSDLAGQFKNDVKIEAIEGYEFSDSSCPASDLTYLQAGSIVVNRYDCPEPNNVELKKEIRGANILLGFKVYEKN